MNIDKLVFLDIQTALQVEKLEVGSDIYRLFKDKKKVEDIDELWEREGNYDPIYNRIVSASLGYEHNGEIHLKTFMGGEKEIIQEFLDTLGKFGRIPSGWGISTFDLPLLRKRAMINNIPYPSQLNDMGMKPWSLADKVFDVSQWWKGASPYASNLFETCWAFNIPCPHNQGGDITNWYYQGEMEKIKEYNESLVTATINLFKVLK